MGSNRRRKAAARAQAQQAASRQQSGQPAQGVRRQQNQKQKEKQRKHAEAKAKARSRRTEKVSISKAHEVVDQVREDGYARHHDVPKAHCDAIMAIVMADGAIYTASRDKKLKRWRAVKNLNRFELHSDLELSLGETCYCLLSAGDWLICGLGDGNLRAYHKTGQDVTLSGHTKRVLCLLTHQHVLLSAGMDGTVRCWQMNEQAQTFVCTHTISEGVSGNVTCMAVLNDHLWVGGTSGIALVELASLMVTHQVPPKKFVAGFLQFDGHMIAAYSDGALSIFDAAGNQKHTQPPLAAGPVMCVAGLESGPRVLVGHAKGQVSSITLPMFKLKTYWQTFERCKARSVCCAGQDGMFLLGSENGGLQLWQRDDSADL